MSVLTLFHCLGQRRSNASKLESIGLGKVTDFECTRFGIKSYCDENKPVSLQKFDPFGSASFTESTALSSACSIIIRLRT